jgi:hypothetical protein
MNALPGPDARARPPPDGGERGAVFTTSSQAPVAALTEAVLSGLRVVALTGEPGISRSAIVDAVAIGLAEADVGLLRVRNGAPGPLGVSRLVALIVGGSYAGAGHRVEDDLQRVVNVLTAHSYRGRRLVLLIEDAENLDRPALAMLRLLPGLPREDSPSAQLVLVGRSGLWTLLAEPTQAPSGIEDTPHPSSSARTGAGAGADADALADAGSARPAEEGGAGEWKGLLASFEPKAAGGSMQAGFGAGKHPARWLAASLGAAAALAVALLAYHAFYRGLPFRPASPPPAVQSAPATAAAPPAPPDAPPAPHASAPPPEPAGTSPEPDAGSAAAASAKPGAPPSTEKLRQDFDAFLLSQGGDLAHLNEADRRELFEQYLKRRLAR